MKKKTEEVTVRIAASKLSTSKDTTKKSRFSQWTAVVFRLGSVVCEPGLT